MTWVFVSVAVSVSSWVIVLSITLVDTHTRVVGTSSVDVIISVFVEVSMSVIVLVAVSVIATVADTVIVCRKSLSICYIQRKKLALTSVIVLVTVLYWVIVSVMVLVTVTGGCE